MVKLNIQEIRPSSWQLDINDRQNFHDMTYLIHTNLFQSINTQATLEIRGKYGKISSKILINTSNIIINTFEKPTNTISESTASIEMCSPVTSHRPLQ